MKKAWKILPIVFYPYLYMICLAVFFFVASNSSDPYKASLVFSLFLFCSAVVCNLYSFLFSFSLIFSAKKGKYTAKELAKWNMIVKVVQIPAYLIHFCLGILGLLMSVWGIPVVLWAILIDFVTIVLSGIVGISANIAAGKEGILPSDQAVLCSILGFVYCVDVFVSVLLFLTVKRKTANDRSPEST